MKQEIIKLLSNRELTPSGIVEALQSEPEETGKVLRYLLEEGALKMENGMLHISK